jgi:hypothetical protein
MKKLVVVLCALILGCTAPNFLTDPDYEAINNSVEMLLKEGIQGEVLIQYIPENPQRGDSYSLSYGQCADNLCKVVVDMKTYWMSNYDKIISIDVFANYTGGIINYLVTSEETVAR